MKSRYDNIRIGLLLGILGPLLAMIGVYVFMFPGDSMSELINSLVSKRVFTKIISLCVLPNLALFFLFINKYYYRTARGILLSTMLFALFVFITKFAL